VEEYLIITGLAIIIQQAKEPFCPALVSDLLGQPAPSAATRAEHNIKIANYKIIKEAYNKTIPG
jgi:hypothetical protein